MNQTKSKRQKTVFPNTDQTCHVWISQTQEYGTNPQRNVYFHGTEIFSYGQHYLMAKFYPEYDVVLVNEHTYSSTTAQHRSAVYSACRHKDTFSVPCPNDIRGSLRTLGDRFMESVFEFFKQNKPYYNGLKDALKQINDLAVLTRNEDLKVILPDELHDLVLEHVEYRKQRNEKLDAKRKLKERRDNVTEKFRVDVKGSQGRIERDLELKKQLKDWLTGDGSRNHYFYQRDTELIRVKDNRVETTGGAEVPLNHALILLRLLENEPQKAIGKRIGAFTVDEIDPEKGLITIGCHTLPIGQAKQVLKPYLENNVVPFK